MNNEKQFIKNLSQRNGFGRRHIGIQSVELRTNNGHDNFECTDSIHRDIGKFLDLFEKDTYLIPYCDFRTTMFYNWFDNVSFFSKEITSCTHSGRRSERVRFRRTMGDEESELVGYGDNKSKRIYHIVKKFYQIFTAVEFQMMATESDSTGAASETKEVHTTTAINLATTEESCGQTARLPTMEELCNTSLDFKMQELTDRYETIVNDSIRVGQPYSKTVILPRDLFADRATSSANLTLFTNFVFSRLEMEIKIMVNAPKFGQGKLIVGWFPDPVDGVDEKFNDPQSLVMRPHAIIDLNTSNSVSITVPQQIRRTFVRNVAHESSNPALAYASMAALQVMTLSNYVTGADQPMDVPIQIMYRFTKVKFAGISFPVNLQMDIIKEISPEIRVAEKLLKRVGFIGNQDKPYDNTIHRYVPTPRLNFSSGVGKSDATPMAYDHESTVTTFAEMINPDDPISIPQLASRWGLFDKFTWKTDQINGTELYKTRAVPLAIKWDSNVNMRPTPLQMASSMHAMYRGSIKYRMEFVSTAFHTGTIQVAISYNRVPGDAASATSTMTHVFQLGETREFEFEVPYISDSMYRRTNARVQFPCKSWKSATWQSPDGGTTTAPFSTILTGVYGDMPLMVEMLNNTFVTIRVMNKMTPIANVSNYVEVLMYHCGGSDFELSSMIPCAFNNWDIYDDRLDSTSMVENAKKLKTFPVFTQDLIDSGRFSKDWRISFQSDFATNFMKIGMNDTDIDQTFKTLMRREVKRIVINYDPSPTSAQDFWDTGVANTKMAGVAKPFYFLPVYMPNHLIRDGDSAAMLGSPHSVLSSMFRHWRGDIRYTFICVSYDKPAPIYFTYIPNMGSILNGKRYLLTKITNLGSTALEGQPEPLFGEDFTSLGFATEVMLPTVNPSLPISVPFHVPHNMAVNTARLDTINNSKAIMARDDVTAASGMIVISCASKITLDVFTSVGDGYNMMNFIGTCKYSQPMMYAAQDDYVRKADGTDQKTLRPTGAANPGTPVTVRTKSAVKITPRINLAETKRMNQVEEQKLAQLQRDIEAKQNEYRDQNMQLQWAKNLTAREQQNLENVNNDIARARETLSRMTPGKNPIPPRRARETNPDDLDPIVFQMDKVTGKAGIKQLLASVSQHVAPVAHNIDSVANDFTAMAMSVSANSNLATRQIVETADVIKRMETKTDGVVKSIDKVQTDFSDLASTIRTLGLDMSGVAHETSNRVAQASLKMGTISANSTRIADKMTETMSYIDDLIKPIIGSMSSTLPADIAKNFVNYTYSFALDVYMLVKNFSFTNLAAYSLKYVMSVFNFNWGTLIGKISELKQILKAKFWVRVVPQGVEVSDRREFDRDASSLFGFFATLIASGLNLKCKLPTLRDSGIGITGFLTDGRNVSHANGVFVLFERIFKALSGAVRLLKNRMKPVAEVTMERLKKKNSELAQILGDIDMVMNPMNKGILVRSDIVSLVWKNYMYAQAYRKQFTLMGQTAPVVSLIKTLTDYIRWVEDNWKANTACPVRLEPWILCIAGESNCGKSIVSGQISSDLLRAIGYKAIGVNPVFTRAPGRKHWDGYENHPAIVYDDWLNLSSSEQANEQLSELNEIKSGADFIPAKAAVNEKGVKANPRLVTLITNTPFADQIKQLCNCPMAIFRRRDCLLYVKRNPDFDPDVHVRELDPERAKRFDHLLYGLGNPIDPGFTQEHVTNWMTHDEMKEFVTREFVKYTDRELQLAKNKLDLYNADLPKGILDLADPMDIFRFREMETAYTENGSMCIPSKLLDKRVDAVIEEVRKLHRVSGQAGRMAFSRREDYEITGRDRDVCNSVIATNLNHVEIPELQLEYLRKLAKRVRFCVPCLRDCNTKDDVAISTCNWCMILMAAIVSNRRLAVEPPEYEISEEQQIAALNYIEEHGIVNIHCPQRCGYMSTKEGCEYWETSECAGCIRTAWINIQKAKKTFQAATRQQLIENADFRDFHTPVFDPHSNEFDFSTISDRYGYQATDGDCWHQREYNDFAHFESEHIITPESNVIMSSEIGSYPIFCAVWFWMDDWETHYDNWAEFRATAPRGKICFRYLNHSYSAFNEKTGMYSQLRFIGVPQEVSYRMHGTAHTVNIDSQHRIFEVVGEIPDPAAVVYSGIAIPDMKWDRQIDDVITTHYTQEQIDTMVRDCFSKRFDWVIDRTNAGELCEEIEKSGEYDMFDETGGAPLKGIKMYGEGVTVSMDPSKVLNSEITMPKALVMCHHCDQMVLIQFGSQRHHVCLSCSKNERKCEYCETTREGVTEAWYPTPFFLLMRKCTNTGNEKVAEFFRKMVHDLVFKLKEFYVVGLALTRMLNPRAVSYQQGNGQPDYVGMNNDDMRYEVLFRKNMDIILTMRGDDTVCNHAAMMEWENPIYMAENWIKMDEICSVYPCKKNCSILESQKSRDDYRRFCHKIHKQTVSIIKEKEHQILRGEDAYEVLQTIPPFTREREFGRGLGEDRWSSYNRSKWAVALDKMWMEIASVFKINETSSKLAIFLKLIGSAVAIIGTITGVYRASKWLVKKMAGSGEQSGEKMLNNKAQKLRAALPALAKFKPGVVAPQNQEEFDNALERKLALNTMLFVIMRDGQKALVMKCMGIADRYAIMPAHYLQPIIKYAGSAEFYLVRPFYGDMAIEYAYSASNFVTSDSDLMLFRVPASMNLFKDIRSYMATAEDFTEYLPKNGTLYVPTNGDSTPKILDVKIDGIKKNVAITTGQQVKDLIQYNYSKNGDCGSILIRSGHRRPILAMHIAGSEYNMFGQRGFGVLLECNMFNDIIPRTVKSAKLDDHVMDVDGAKIALGHVKLQSLAISEIPAFNSDRSNLKRSKIYDCTGLGPLKLPAFLSRKEDGYPHVKSPLVLGVEKHGKLTRNFTTDVVEEVGTVLYDALYATMQPLVAQPRRLTFLEAIRSFSVEGYRNPLDLNTSAGYPFALTNRKQKKDYITWLNPGEQEIEKRQYSIEQPVLEHLLEMEKMRGAGIVPPLMYIDSLKDELRGIEKRMKPGGTRVICVAPLSTTLADRQNHMHFTAAYMANRFRQQHAVGLSKDGPEWSTIANSLLEYGNNIVSLDYSNFGPGYNAMVCAQANKIIADWTEKYVDGVERVELDVLAEEHFNSQHLVGDLIYRQLSGGPSGSAMTVVKNGLVNELYLLIAWRALYPNVTTGEHLQSMYVDYFANVRAVTYGDDVIMSITDDVIEWFNGQTITQFFGTYGIAATDAEKTAEIKKFKTLEESTFLKCGFKKHPKLPGQYLAPLAVDSVIESANWIRGSEDDGRATVENADQAVRNMFGHGCEAFDAYKLVVNHALSGLGLNSVLVTWDELDKRYFRDEYLKVNL